MDNKATTIEYTSTRKDLGVLYSYLLKHSFKMRCLILALVILPGGVPVLLELLSGQRVPLQNWIIGLIVGVAIYFAYPWYFRRTAKKDKRTLSISPVGITTQVGSKHGEIAWSQVENLWVTQEYVFIVRGNLNAFVIPKRAFRDDEERIAFIRLSQEYWGHSK
jgi:hypothetical protein